MEGKPNKPVLIVAGPTASGKSALALAVAEAFDGVVINADSMQVYAELRILTARPSARDEARVAHRLYGVLPVTEVCSAARWREMAVAAIAEAHDAGRLPIVCGGTGLYLRALMQGLSPIPEIPEDIRRDVRARLDREGPAAQHARLAACDPETAERLEPGDRQRVARALEVLAGTGRPLSEWLALPPEGPPPDMRFEVLLLTPPREPLYAACDERLLDMVRAGALEEVERLRQDGTDPSLPAMRALGMPVFLQHQSGELGLEEAIDLAQLATRRYAKRQMTWFRNQIISNFVVNEQYSEKFEPEIFAFIRQNLLTKPN
ncbi:MAG: tRNA (adenosine(37)-N6)-dimethylallyltransferase MiaA [Alphaproteobacteria bacterium]|nr:tRNA (adenosine(37)-N6)-dimethylallyltransferase MiaA [Alphaproteobacteria bacterium]